jgi:hypothetical protein
MNEIAYYRVSTSGQTIEAQRGALLGSTIQPFDKEFIDEGVYPFHCPLDLPIGDGTEFEWEDDPMPRYASYDEMIARDPKFAFWANEARQRFTNLSMHVRMMRDTPRDADEKIWQWADRAYALIAAKTGADLPDPDLSRLIDRDYDILQDDEGCRI